PPASASKPPTPLVAPPPPPPPPPPGGVHADAPRGPGALVVGVYASGPGHRAGLARGDTLLAFGGARIRSAADLAARVAAVRPGRAVTVTVRHASGGRQTLPVRPGVVT
uniref:PDZ domain-containing protein n=1 Tax=Streptomyces flavofungini TaxID=68200 RepID=UPI0034DDF70E